MYNEKVLKHFSNPSNQGEIKNADGVGLVGNPTCGDMMRIFISVSKNKKGEEIIKDIKFQTLGCGAAIATSSMLTEMAKGKTIAEAEKIGKLQIAEELGGLPAVKMHCSVLAHEGLGEAIKDYRSKNKKLKK
ncbi:MAG: iron-sulfur cluster assembly scaffold protein [bacterium]